MLFQAYLFPSIIENNNKMLKAIQDLPRKYLLSNPKGYISQHDESIKSLVSMHRDTIYDKIHENEFCSIFPEMRPIKRLDISNMKKCILLMCILEFDLSYIADFLYSSRASIYTTRHSLYKEHSKLLKRYEKQKNKSVFTF